ncbi:MAG: OprO/OprP family phosphate-selective porin [Rhodospirillales bacterium]
MPRKQIRTLLVAAVGAAAVLGQTPSAHAMTNEELLRIIRRQAEQIDVLTRKVEVLEQKTTATEAGVEAAKEQAAEAQKTAEAADTGVEFKLGPAPTIRSKDGRFEFKVRGRLLTDFNLVRSGDDPRNVGGSRISTTSTEFRSARLGAEGTAWKDVKFTFEADFADNAVDITDAFIAYVGEPIKPAKYIRIGQYKTPNSLEEQTSGRFTTFMERAAFTDAFDFDRRIGIGTGFGGKQWTFDVGLFSQNNGDSGSSLNEGYAVAGRGTYAFTDVLGSADLMHVGASARFRDLSNQADNRRVRYRQRPFFHDTNRSVDTGTLREADNDVIAGIEWAYVAGPLSLQAEAAHTWLNRDNADDADGLWGGYFDVSYFLTDDTRAYRSGRFDRVKVKNPVFGGGWGAWQVGGRFDYIDLNGDDVRGGEQYSIIGGVNWYLNDHARMMVNGAYTRVFNARGMGGNQIEGSSNNIWGVGMRGQVDF